MIKLINILKEIKLRSSSSTINSEDREYIDSMRPKAQYYNFRDIDDVENTFHDILEKISPDFDIDISGIDYFAIMSGDYNGGMYHEFLTKADSIFGLKYGADYADYIYYFRILEKIKK